MPSFQLSYLNDITLGYCMLLWYINLLAHVSIVFFICANRVSLDEHVQMHSLARAFDDHNYIVGTYLCARVKFVHIALLVICV